MSNINSISITSKEPIKSIPPVKYKSKIIYGNIEIMLEKHINWFHRLMIRLIFGIKVEKVGDK